MVRGGNMCGFIGCKKDGFGSNEFIKRRGEDGTFTYEYNGHIFIHNLLSITGNSTPQPFVDGDIVCVYNGEIYNLPFQRSDGENIIPMYKKYGPDFPRHLDGEFAIVLYDFGNNVAIFTTDAFRMKPIWLNQDGAASYASGLSRPSQPLPFNTTVIRDLKTGIDRTQTVHDFNFNNQVQDSYGDWIKAFETAVLKRTQGKRVFIGLSSGYDSGAIHLALTRLKQDYAAYSIQGNENLDILRARNTILPFTKSDYESYKAYLNQYMEDYEYDIHGNRNRLRNESSAFGMAYIMQLARKDGRRVYLSGQGADEIISDYGVGGVWNRQSDFKGVWPQDLKGPWTNFYGGANDAYVMKEEYVGGVYSVETRYPYLDTEVVQSFLNLTVNKKNVYKGCIAEYMRMYNYPFKEGEKLGFDAHGRI